MRNPTFAATLLAASVLAAPALAQTGAPTGQTISPSPMQPGSPCAAPGGLW